MQTKTTISPNIQIQIFDHPEFGKIRSVLIDGEPWLVGKDVAKAMGYSNTKKALIDHVDAEDKGVTKRDPCGNVQQMVIINESGLYSLILSSKLPVAKKFKRWVTSEVLPAIRKTGSYQMPNTTNPKIDLDSTLKVIQALQKTPAEQMPVVLDFLSNAGYPVSTYKEIYGQPPALLTLPTPKQVSQQDSVQLFVNQIIPQFKWDFYPFKILFALYKSWVDQEQICSNPLGRNKFIKTIASMADAKRIPNWYCPGRKHPVRPKRMMASEEPLMSAYNIDITHYLGKETYTGIHRIRK